MYPDEHELLESLAAHYRGKREALSSALYALNRELKEREAGTQAGREAIFKRLAAIEEQLSELSQAMGNSRRTSTGRR
jgi:predicted  nucleic acid-binding Zn-ribbon protein